MRKDNALPARRRGLPKSDYSLDSPPHHGDDHSTGDLDISENEANCSPALRAPDRSAFPDNSSRRNDCLTLRMPRAEDGPRVSKLIALSPPLDVNSGYCNLLQCTDFRDTCILAERGSALLGWISAYRPPSSPEQIFIWQVAVDPAARGQNLARNMLDALIARPAVATATALTTTITEDNEASWALFRAFARRHGATLTRSPRFDRQTHFAGAHDTEWEARISPLPALSK